MLQRSRVYLDNAATSWPKPSSVYDVVDDYHRRLGASVGRGGYAEAEEVGQAVAQTRSAVARLIGAESPDRIIFTLNGTDSLNQAIYGILKPGDHVVTSIVEHNSVLRPLRKLERLGQVEVTRVACDEFGVVRPEDIRIAIRPSTRLIVLTHASNVTGAIQPVMEVGAIAREYGILFLVDAAQTLGHLHLSVSEIGADLLAAPGHKGLLGPLGTGILYIRSGLEEFVQSVRQGGTGSASSSEDQPDALPEKYESGSHNTPGIIGLGAGIEYVEQRGLADLRQHSIDLMDRLLAGLSDIPGVTFFGPRSSADRIGVVSAKFAEQVAPSVARRMEKEFRIQVRGGFQCAALMHRSLGTLEQQGAVRFSVGPFNSVDDIDTAIEAARIIAGNSNTAAESVACPCVAIDQHDDHLSPAASLVLPAAAKEGSKVVSSRSGTDIADIPGLHELWNETLGDPRICIAILDGPVDLSHPCFQGADIVVHPTAAASSNRGAATQHGTHVASVIFGQHHSEVKGIAPHCHGVVIPVFRDAANGEVVPCSQIDLARAITVAAQYAKDRGAAALLINISGGQLSESGVAHPLLGDVVNNLSDGMHLIVSAAGNQGCDCLHIPGALPTVLAVGAMSRNGSPLGFSNWGKSYQAQGLLAIGEDIRGASVDHRTEIRTGTSYATPIVTGVAALLLGVQLKRSGIVSAESVRRALIKSTINCEQEPIKDCRRLLAGRLDVSSALLTLIDLGTTEMTDDGQLDHPASKQVTPRSHEPIVSSASRIPEARNEIHAASVAPPSAVNSGYSASGSHFSSNLVLPAGCGCASGDAPVLQKVYAVGKLGFDYGSRQRRDYFRNAMKIAFRTEQDPDPDNSKNLYEYLVRRPEVAAEYQLLNGRRFMDRTDVTALTWILTIDGTPVYAILPQGAFAFEAHDTFLSFLKDQEFPGQNSEETTYDKQEQRSKVEPATRVALPGIIIGETRLYTGEQVPLVAPDQRGLANWNVNFLSTTLKESINEDEAVEFVETVLDRLHELTRNLGLESQHRATNYAATDALLLGKVLSDNIDKFKKMELDTIDVTPSPLCRPGYDCWDVTIIFYDPNSLMRARRAVRYTVDVSDTVPYLLGDGSERVFTLR